MTTKNPLSAMSYTNKDFGTVFVELLDLVKELSSKWDPTISNESDPGVILLKVNAIIADKNNYNIDKNILEAFPETVTQLENARSMYKQLAYNMAWYRAAKTTVMFKWIGELGKGVVAEIPRYTMVTNEDASVVFTLLNPVEFTADEPVSSSEVIQGTIVQHTVNGSDIITLSHLDSNNRLYLNDYSVAENGIFITNEDAKDTDLWTRVENLQVRTRGNKFFEFGVDVRNGVCYVEFPEDISDLIGNGLKVRYITTDGAAGNISAKEIDRFYDEISIEVAGESVALTTEVVQLYNGSAAVDGADPEDIETAYKSYKKVAGTFDTLVTLRDYVNAIYNSGFVSNCQVCDRFNDPQSSYEVITEDTASPVYTYQASTQDNAEVVSYAKLKDTVSVNTSSGDYYQYDETTHSMTQYTGTVLEGMSLYYRYSDATTKDLTAFDLRMYLLKNVGTVQNINQYYDSFTPVPSDSTTQKQVVGYISDQKCISHDFKDIIPNQFFMFKLSYPIGVKIVPQYKLQQTDIDSVKANINSALRELLNSRMVEFGEEPNYDLIYDAIENSDERIKLVILDDFDYTVFATYWDANEKVFKDIPLSNSNSPLVICVDDNYQNFHTKAKELVDNKQKDILNSAYFFTNSQSKPLVGNSAPYADKGAFYKYDREEDGEYKFKLYSTLRDEFRLQIIAKSILAGKTPLFKQEDKFEYGLNQEYIDSPTTDRVTTNLVISPFAQPVTDTEDALIKDIVVKENEDNGTKEEAYIYPTISSADDRVIGEYTLQENESIRFLAPSFTTQKSFSNYVKFEFVKKNKSGTQLIQLDPNEYTIGNSARIHVDDYKKLVSYDIDNMLNSFVQTGVDSEGLPYSRLVLSTEVDTDTTAVARAKYKSGANAGLFTISVRHWGAPIQLYIDGYSEGELVGGIAQMFPYKTDENGKIIRDEKSSKTIPLFDEDGNRTPLTIDKSDSPKVYEFTYVADSDVKSFGITFYTVSNTDAEGKSEAFIDNISITSELGTAFNKQWTFLAATTGGNEPSMTWNYLSESWRQWKASTQEPSFYNSKDYTLWESKYIKLYNEEDVYAVPADSEYQLEEGDYITFFWREADDDTAPYVYESYKGIAKETATNKSPVIKPSFVLNGVPKSKAQITPDNLKSTGTIPYGGTDYYKVTQFVGENDLSGSKEIQLRGMNQLELKSSEHEFYFITNTIDEDGNYVLPLKRHIILNSDGIEDNSRLYYRYSLGTDEYFIYTNKSKQALEILGSGTLIAIDTEYKDSASATFELKVEAVTVEDISNNGISAITDWKTVDWLTMFVREQQIHNLVAGDKLQISVTADVSSSKNDEGPKFTVIYDTGTTKNYSYESGNSINRPFFTSKGETIVDGFDVSYVSNGTSTTLPIINIKSSDAKWAGRACLNIDCDADDAQSITPVSKSLQSMQSITIQEKTTPEQTIEALEEYVVTDTDQQAKNLYIESDVLVNKVGGDNIDVSYVTLDGNRKDINFYIYSLSPSFSNTPFNVRDDGDIELYWSQVIDGVVVPEITLAEGNYILSLYNQSDSQSFELSAEGGTLSPLSNPKEIRGRYYYYLKVNSDNSLKLKFTLDVVDGVPESDVLIISSLFKFAPNDDFAIYGFSHQDLMDEVERLDFEDRFKYNHIVDDSVKIDDPLVAKTFFNSEHVFNENSIGKAELLLDTTGSYIHIVNNR